MRTSDLSEIVWGETGDVVPKDGADATLERLHAVVAKLSQAAEDRGLKLHTRQAPRVNAPEAARFQKLEAAVKAIQSDEGRRTKLPARAALWEITMTGAPRLPLPKTVSWIVDHDVHNGGDFVVADGSDGKVYRLFETDKSAPDGEWPFASAVSGSGLPEAEAPNFYRKLAWVLGITAAVIFLVGGALAEWSGRSMSGARGLLATNEPLLQQALLVKIAETCAADYVAFPAGPQAPVCDKVLTTDHKMPPRDPKTGQVAWPEADRAVTVLQDAAKCPVASPPDGCNTIWRAAVTVDQEQTWKASLFVWLHVASAYLTGTDPAAGSTSILLPFLLLVGGIAGLAIALGLGTKQRVAGIWIDTRNRVSLARAQVTLWTAVALAGYAAFALFNIGFAGIAAATGNIATFAAFPSIPGSIAAALGIAAVSPMISALILPTKDAAGKNVDISVRGAPFFGAGSEGLDKRASPLAASITDIFMGEEKADAHTVDVSRLQNVVITIMLVLGFSPCWSR